jgi:regulator of protease activity HflC (stomatin/prohibitin superfamily)
LPFLLVIILLIASGFFIVKQQTANIIERLGKFQSFATAGLHFRIPILDTIAGSVTLKIQQLDLYIETKTKDNVFVKIMIAVQYQVILKKIYDAYYKLESPTQQIQAYVFDVVRAQVPNINLDDVFSKKDEIAIAVKNELGAIMNDFGYEIIKTLVIDIQPSENVRHAMNEINAAQRMRIAANEKAEAEKIIRVKQAEAESEANILHGKGISGQRQAITDGLSKSLEEMQKHCNEMNVEKIIEMILLIQYFDTLKDIGGHSKSNVVFVPHSPDAINNLRETIFSGKIFEKEENK